jgi:hypothetical protein
MIFLLVAALFQGAALAALGPGAAKGAVPAVHGPMGAPPPGKALGMIEVIKGATLPGYAKMKIGDAMDRYSHFKTKQWREVRSSGGTFYVDFVASAPPRLLDLKSRWAGISSSGIEVKFAVYPNGEYGVVMVSKTVVKTDGRTNRYPLPDVKSVLDAIYSNRKIDL